jgi:hypothetical protein
MAGDRSTSTNPDEDGPWRPITVGASDRHAVKNGGRRPIRPRWRIGPTGQSTVDNDAAKPLYRIRVCPDIRPPPASMRAWLGSPRWPEHAEAPAEGDTRWSARCRPREIPTGATRAVRHRLTEEAPAYALSAFVAALSGRS